MWVLVRGRALLRDLSGLKLALALCVLLASCDSPDAPAQAAVKATSADDLASCEQVIEAHSARACVLSIAKRQLSEEDIASFFQRATDVPESCMAKGVKTAQRSVDKALLDNESSMLNGPGLAFACERAAIVETVASCARGGCTAPSSEFSNLPQTAIESGGLPVSENDLRAAKRRLAEAQSAAAKSMAAADEASREATERIAAADEARREADERSAAAARSQAVPNDADAGRRDASESTDRSAQPLFY